MAFQSHLEVCYSSTQTFL